MKPASQQKVARIDLLIQKGKYAEAKKLLSAIDFPEKQGPYRCSFAALARRLHLPMEALRILNPVVRPTGRRKAVPTPNELVEYAANLIKIGGAKEASDILSSEDVSDLNAALLYSAFAKFAVWDYADAIPILERYVSREESPYQILVGNVNLSAAYVFEKDHRAEALLLQNVEQAAQNGHQLLLANSLMLSAQWQIDRGHWEKAEALLRRAEETISPSEGLDPFLIFKWKGILELYRSEGNERSAIDEARRLATSKKHYETLRSLDYHEAVVTKSRALVQKLYFGTPHPNFRRRLMADTGTSLELPAKYDWGSPGAENVLDVRSGSFEPTGVRLKPSQAFYRLLSILSSDLYRPIRMASLHAALYPGEFFNPHSSPGRLHQSLNRLRKWLSHYRIGIHIVEANGFYSLAYPNGLIRLSRPEEKVGGDAVLLEQIRSNLNLDSFTAKEIEETLGMSRSSSLRFLKRAYANGELRSTGKGKSCRYSLRR